MKKIWKILGVAALIGSIPLVFTKDPVTGELGAHALLWNVKITPDPDDPSAKPNVSVNIGAFTNPVVPICCCGGNCHCHDEEEAVEAVVEEIVEEVTPEDLAD